MISVPNLRLPSNGNKTSAIIFIWFFALFVLASSCDALKKIPKEDTSDKKEELDEIKGKTVYNPKTGKWEKVTEVDGGTMDTIAWKEPAEDVAPPITNDGTSSSPIQGYQKDRYNVAVLLPFMTNYFQELDARINAKSKLAIHFYGGMQMAFEKLSADGVQLNVSVHDTRASEGTVENLLKNNDKVLHADLIIGPISKKNLKLVAAFAKNNKKPMVAPLSPSTSITDKNPFYLQVSPSLESHCKTITRHALEHYDADQIVLVCRSKAAETKRLKYFQTAHQEVAGSPHVKPFKEFIITDTSVDLNETEVEPYIIAGKTTVFIVPSWSNESFIYALLRKISIAKGKNKVVVYGMPQWMKYEQIDYDYYDKLNLHLSSDTDINSDLEEVKQFKRKFYHKFGTLPREEAFVGYDVMRYFGQMLHKHGTQFQQKIDQEGQDLLHTRFDFIPVAPKDAKPEDYSKIERYENQYVNILQFKDFHFQLAE